MKSKLIKYLLFIAVLCLSFGIVGALPTPGGTSGAVVKNAKGNFKAVVKRTLTILLVPGLAKPYPDFPYARSTDDVIPASYILLSNGISPTSVFTINGEPNHKVHIKSFGVDFIPEVGSGNLKYNAKQENEGVTLYMDWQLIDDHAQVYTGNETAEYLLNPIEGKPNEGEIMLSIYYRSIEVTKTATTGDHTFYQEIQAWYADL